jgi:hypothetical protein
VPFDERLVTVLFAQGLLAELVSRGFGDLVDEDDDVRDPPLGGGFEDVVAEAVLQRVVVDALVRDDQRERSLLPALVGDAEVRLVVAVMVPADGPEAFAVAVARLLQGVGELCRPLAVLLAVVPDDAVVCSGDDLRLRTQLLGSPQERSQDLVGSTWYVLPHGPGVQEARIRSRSAGRVCSFRTTEGFVARAFGRRQGVAQVRTSICCIRSTSSSSFGKV